MLPGQGLDPSSAKAPVSMRLVESPGVDSPLRKRTARAVISSCLSRSDGILSRQPQRRLRRFSRKRALATASRRSRLDEKTSRHSRGTVALPPIRRKLPSSRMRRNLACKPGGICVTSSREREPPLARPSFPTFPLGLGPMAPGEAVKAPRSQPKGSPLCSSALKGLQVAPMSWPPESRLTIKVFRATSSLPEPASPSRRMAIPLRGSGFRKLAQIDANAAPTRRSGQGLPRWTRPSLSRCLPALAPPAQESRHPLHPRPQVYPWPVLVLETWGENAASPLVAGSDPFVEELLEDGLADIAGC